MKEDTGQLGEFRYVPVSTLSSAAVDGWLGELLFFW